MNESQTAQQIVAFLSFAAISFILLRAIFNALAQRKSATLAAPLLAVAGAAAAAIFVRLNLDTYFIWYVIFFGLVFTNWLSQSRRQEKKVIEASGPAATKPDADAVQSFAMQRRLMSFGLASYLAAFCAAYYFLFAKH